MSEISQVAADFSQKLCLNATAELARSAVSTKVIDVRVLDPLDRTGITESVAQIGRLIAVDGGWSICGPAAEILSRAAESTTPEPGMRSPAG